MAGVNIHVWCDASPNKGLGHLFRCLTLLDKMESSFQQAYFTIPDLDESIASIVLRNQHKITKTLIDSSKINEFHRENSIHLMIIDSYEFPIEKEKKIYENGEVKIFSIDDLHTKHFCHYLLNHNIHSKKENYFKLVPNGCIIYAGPSYSLIRKSFENIKKNQTGQLPIKDYFLIALGGTDHRNLSINIFNVIKSEYREKKVVIATTKTNQHIEELVQISNEDKQLIVRVDDPNFPSLLKNAKMAIISPSGIMIESIYLCTPFIAVNTADNQSRNVQFLMEHNLPLIDTDGIKNLNKTIREELIKGKSKNLLLEQIRKSLGTKIKDIKDEIQKLITIA